MTTLPLTASLVVYRSDPEELTRLLQSLATANLTGWVVVDNGTRELPERSRELQLAVKGLGGLYVASPGNIGFGAGHNLALSQLSQVPSEFHVLVNPDIEFGPGVLPSLLEAMRVRPATGMLMPRVVYPDGTFQPLCKLLPTPWDFALRRFAPGWVQRLFKTRLEQYEMQGVEHVECDRVPFLSGCFLFTRRSVLESVGGFDERYFLYMEDVDLCRRMAARSELLYLPSVSVIHGCARGAYHNRKLMVIFLQSAVRYFGRWGWVFDSWRSKANREAVAFLRKLPD